MHQNEEPKTYEHPVGVKFEHASAFLEQHFGKGVSNVEPVGKGLWSQAFFFTHANVDYVLRFGNESESYEKDEIATRYSSEALPIPNVTEIGTVDKHHFAISERRPGTMIDELSESEIESLSPALVDMLNALREVDVSATKGYGHWSKDEIGQYSSWREFLLDVGNDDPKSKIHGWRTSLETSPQGADFFDDMVAKLRTLAGTSYEGRHLVHTDLLHFNVLAQDGRISAVIDWGNAMYGDFLYDLANFTFWAPLHPAMQKINWIEMTKKYFQEKGVEIEDFDERLRACELHIGLAGMAWNAHTKNWQELEATTKRVKELFGES